MGYPYFSVLEADNSGLLNGEVNAVHHVGNGNRHSDCNICLSFCFKFFSILLDL